MHHSGNIPEGDGAQALRSDGPAADGLHLRAPRLIVDVVTQGSL